MPAFTTCSLRYPLTQHVMRVVVGTLLLSSGTLAAQETIPSNENSEISPQLKIKEAELVKLRRDIVRDTLKLEPEVAKRFWPLYEEYLGRLSELRSKRREVLSDLGQGVDGMSEEEAREYVNDKLEFEQRRLSDDHAYYRKLATFMDYRTLALYLQVEDKIRVYIEAGIEESIPLIR